MAKTLSLTVQQRVNLCNIFEVRPTRNVGEYRTFNKILTKLELSKEETEHAGITEFHVGDPNGVSFINKKWKDNFSTDISFEDAEHDAIKSVLAGPVEGLNLTSRIWLNPLLDQLGL